MKDEIKKLVATRIDEVCKREDCDVKALAVKVGMPPSTFQRYATGANEPRFEFMLALFNYGINLHWLLTGEGTMKRSDDPNRLHELTRWIEHYLSTRTTVEQGWLEVEIAKKFPDYNDWRADQGLEPVLSDQLGLLNRIVSKGLPAADLQALVDEVENERKRNTTPRT